MRLTFVQNQARRGCRDEWTVSAHGVGRKGIGKTQSDAVDALIRANPGDFNITEWKVDTDHEPKDTLWVSRDRTHDQGDGI
jgi:hypothetical protein